MKRVGIVKKTSQVCFYYRCLVIGIITTLLISCSPTPTAKWHFDGELESLMLSKTDGPAGWEFDSWTNPMTVDNLVVAYYAPIDQILTPGLLNQGIFVFEKEDDAIYFLDEHYQSFLDTAMEEVEELELNDWDYTPFQEYTYESSIADDFRVIFYPEVNMFGPFIGFNYFVFVRYGNVVSTFFTVVEDKELTELKPGEVNVLPWKDIEPLLRIIDNKFAEAGKVKS